MLLILELIPIEFLELLLTYLQEINRFVFLMGEQLQKRCIRKTCDTNLHTDVSYIHVHKHMHTINVLF